MSEELVSLCAGHSGSSYPGTVRWLCLYDEEAISARKHIQKITGYTFNKYELLCEALYSLIGEVACIFGHEDRLLAQGNQMMAMVGDTVMKTAILDCIYLRYKKQSCKSLSNQVQHFITNENLCLHAQSNGVDKLVARFYPEGEDASPRAIATTVEAIIGAIWLDSGRDIHVTRAAMMGLIMDP